MAGTMTWAGLDVHARSTHAAAIDAITGELVRARFGPGVEAPVAWLTGLPGPVRACYEAGPTGFGLFRAAEAAGVVIEVIAPGKTPRGPSDRVKTDRKDAELLARLLLAGSLTPVVVPPPEFEAARDLMRAHDAARRDLMTARHRVSKLLLRHGRVYPEPSTWTVCHRAWLARQSFEHVGTELALLDALACVEGLTARKAALAERLSQLALDEQWWPTVARLRSFHLPRRDAHRPDNEAFEDAYAPDAFAVQLLGPGYAGRVPDSPAWQQERVGSASVLLEHIDLPAWFDAPFVPYGSMRGEQTEPPALLAHARAELAPILYTPASSTQTPTSSRSRAARPGAISPLRRPNSGAVCQLPRATGTMER